MKVCLGMLARSDRAAEPLLDRVLSIVGPSFEAVEVLRDEGRPITDFAAARNRLIDAAERRGDDWMFMLDSDECMFPADIAAVRSMMTPDTRLIVLPRYEFARDFDHYDPGQYPDYQTRVFRLGHGYRFRRKVHEGLYRRFALMSEKRLGHGLVSEQTPIYHYGRVKTPAQLELKTLNYRRIARDQRPLGALPADFVVDESKPYWVRLEPFDRPHPLGADTV